MDKTIDSIQDRITRYANNLRYEDLPADVVHAAKARVIDVLGALIAGFFGEPCRILRNLAAQMPNSNGATVIGTRMRTSPEMAALVNATTARYPELTDSYHSPGSFNGHPSDTVTPVLVAAEYAQASGRELITGVVLAYEVFLRISDVFNNEGFCNTNFACLGTAAAAGKLLKLSSEQLAHCVSMAAVANIILRQVRRGHMSMFKAAASGYAGRAGVFSALLARAGMEGPHLPFEGKAGWCDHVARKRFSLNAMGGNDTPFKIVSTNIKIRPSEGRAINCILAAEKIAPLKDIRQVKQITVEVYKWAVDMFVPFEEQYRNPVSKEDADHSIPYVVAATLMDGTVTLRSYDEAHLWNPDLRALIQKTEIVENPEFTKAFERVPMEERIRITVTTQDGNRLVAESGGDEDDLAAPKSDAQIEKKFRGVTEDRLGVKRVDSILDRLWHLEEIENIAEIPRAFALE